MSTAPSIDHGSSHGHHAEPYQGGVLRWLTTTNHKDIGTMYMTFSLIMFFIGSGPVRGFAVTLLIGIITSMFTAVYVTRFIVETWMAWRRPKDIVV